MWYVYEKFMLTATFGTFLPCAQLDWLFLQIPEMSANCLEFHNLSLIWLGSTFWWISWHPCTVQIARNGAAYPALWDQEQLCLLLPRYCEEGVARIKAQVSLKGLFWWFPGWFTGPGEVGKRHVTWLHLRTLCPSVWVGAAVSQARAVLNHQHPRAQCVWATVSLKFTSYLSNRSHQNKLLKARHRSTLPGFSVKGEKWSLWDLSCLSGNQYQSSTGFNESRVQPRVCDI